MTFAGVHDGRGGNLVDVGAVVHHRLEVQRRDGERGRVPVGQRRRRLPHRLVPAVDRHLQLAPRLLLPARHQPRAVDGDPGGTHHLGLDHEVLERGRRRAEHRDEVAALEVHRQRRPGRGASNLEDVLAPAGNVVAFEAVGALDGLHRERLDAAREEDLADLVLDVLGARLEGAKQRAARLLSRRLVRAFGRLLRRRSRDSISPSWSSKRRAWEPQTCIAACR